MRWGRVGAGVGWCGGGEWGGARVGGGQDWVGGGGSGVKACGGVKGAGVDVVAVGTVLDRGEGGREAIEAAGYQLRALFTRPELVELAKED